jgi:predicted RNA binding protein YcfA (HicA-like mRNA interferase family)
MTSKERKRLHRRIEALGFTLVRDKRHLVYRHPVHGLLVMGATTSDHRAVKNALARAQRMTQEQ